MPSKTPWPNPLSGFAEGLESGTKMGLLRRQQNLAEQESLAKAAEAEVKAKREDIAAKFAAAKELQGVRHPAIQKARLNMYATTVKKNAEYFGIDPSAIPDNIEWNDDFTIPLKELDSAFEAWKEGKISDSQGLQALRETMTKMGGVMDSADVEKLRAEKEKQFGEMQQGRALQGASDISTRIRMRPDIVAQTDPVVLEGIESEKNRLMVEGGATPEQMLFKGTEGGKTETGLVTVMGEDKKPHAILYEKSTGNTIKDMGVVKSETESGRDYVTVVTDKGIFSVNKKTNTASPVRTEEGDRVWGKTPSEIKTAVKNLDDNIAAVKGVKEIYDAGIPGAISGRAHKYGSKFFSDKEYTQLKNRVGQLRTLVYGLSGKQINETELQWLKEEILPSLIQPSDNFEITLAEYDAWVKRNRSLFETQYPDLSSQKPAGQETKSSTPSSGWGIERID